MEAEYDDSIEDKESVKQRLLQSWILFGWGQSFVGLRIPPYCVITDVHSVGLSQAFGPEQLTKRVYAF